MARDERDRVNLKKEQAQLRIRLEREAIKVQEIQGERLKKEK
jgi:hypothetical protein